jgi:ribosome-associated protein
VLSDLRIAAATLEGHKAIDLVVLDLRGLSDATDYFVLASGTSDTHVRALTEHVIEALKEVGRKAHHVEGVKAGRWALLDYVEFVVHVFHPTLREFYQLERLWVDAPSLPIETDGGTK